ncbi:MAG TPA: hypothetical protein VF006_18690 [Longimicrobium sp.]
MPPSAVPSPAAAAAPDTTDLLLRAWELERAGQLVELRALLEGIPSALLADEPDLGLLLASTYTHLRDLERAERTLHLIAPTCRGRHNDRLFRRFLTRQGVLMLFRGRLNESREVHTELMHKSLQADDPATLLWSTMHLAIIHSLKCEWPEAVALHGRAVPLARTVDGGQWLRGVHHNFAATYRHMGRLDESQRHFEASALCAPRDDAQGWAVERAELMRLRGEHDVAERLIARAYAEYRRVVSPTGMANVLMALVRLEMARGRLPEARAAADEAQALLPRIEVVDWGELYEEIAVLEAMDGHPGASEDAQERAAEIYTLMDAPRRISNMLQRLRGRPALRIGLSTVYRG